LIAAEFPSDASRLAGVSEGTLDGGSGAPSAAEPFVDFAEASVAELECEFAVVEKWKDAASEDWHAGKEFLARRFAEHWGPKRELSTNPRQSFEFTFA